MATITCPGNRRFTKQFNVHSIGVRAGATADAAWSLAAKAIEKEFFRLVANTVCASGCHGPYWHIINADVYVKGCSRIWWTFWIAVKCDAVGKLDVRAHCTAFTLEDVLGTPDADRPEDSP